MRRVDRHESARGKIHRRDRLGGLNPQNDRAAA
jgi:hypothetical protein